MNVVDALVTAVAVNVVITAAIFGGGGGGLTTFFLFHSFIYSLIHSSTSTIDRQIDR